MENNTFLEGKIAAPLIRFAIPLMMSLVPQRPGFEMAVRDSIRF